MTQTNPIAAVAAPVATADAGKARLFPAPPAPIPATSLADCDRMLTDLEVGRDRWVALSAADRAKLLRACIPTMLAVSDRWASVACSVKGYVEGSQGHG